MVARHSAGGAGPGCGIRSQGFGELFGEGAAGAAVAGLLRPALFATAWWTLLRCRSGRSRATVAGGARRAFSRPVGGTVRTSHYTARALASRLRRLSWISPKQTVLERRSIETADDRIHLLRIRRIDKREALRLLRF